MANSIGPTLLFPLYFFVCVFCYCYCFCCVHLTKSLIWRIFLLIFVVVANTNPHIIRKKKERKAQASYVTWIIKAWYRQLTAVAAVTEAKMCFSKMTRFLSFFFIAFQFHHSLSFSLSIWARATIITKNKLIFI